MPFANQKTTLMTRQNRINRWIHVDATDQVLGRLASRIAMILMGKNKPTYTPHVDTGDFVVVTNCSKIKVTGTKLDKKSWFYYTNYPSGLKEVTWRKMYDQHPERLLRLAVQRMLPKTAMGRHMLAKLKAYKGSQHHHQAQNPETVKLCNS